MHNLRELDRFRDRSDTVKRVYGWTGDDKGGVFNLRSDKRANANLRVIASDDDGWDHLVVAAWLGETMPTLPSWLEMEQVKRMFFLDDEVAMQLHHPVSNYINLRNNSLHIWRPHPPLLIPMPPKEVV